MTPSFIDGSQNDLEIKDVNLQTVILYQETVFIGLYLEFSSSGYCFFLVFYFQMNIEIHHWFFTHLLLMGCMDSAGIRYSLVTIETQVRTSPCNMWYRIRRSPVRIRGFPPGLPVTSHRTYHIKPIYALSSLICIDSITCFIIFVKLR